ncbi:MAG: hypothetical protein V1494_03185 [Candidatus Diapherotrites archaeon]
MKHSSIILAAFIAAVLLLTGCTSIIQGETGAPKAPELATQACILLCEQKLAEGMDLTAGPCLSNEIYPDWVCDVAHTPRAAADNNPANQCPEYAKTKSHFVEVNPNCQLIRAN